MRNAKPKDLKEVADLNSLMRLMAQPGQELPLDKYVKFKQNIHLWYEEMDNAGVPKVEVPILEKHYLPSYGVPNAQEQLMLLVMDKDVCGLSESEANMIRKAIGKKQMSKIPEVKDLIFKTSKLSIESTNYMWKTAVETQLGYSFSLLHTLGYSCISLQELNLYNHFPSIYWNTGCLIVNSGDETGSSTDYSKMAVALGATINHGIKVELTDINESVANFHPNPEKDYISYGLRSLSGVGYDFIQTIINGRPYVSLEDFYTRAKPNKTQMLTLIKSGAFRKIDNENRKVSLLKYAKLVTPKRKNLTIAQTGLLVAQGLIPDSLNQEKSIYEFNRYVKEVLTVSGEMTILDERAQNFLTKIGQEELIQLFGSWVVMSTDKWKAFYDNSMNSIRAFLKENKQELLAKIFDAETIMLFNDYGGQETFAKWEMDSMNFYYTEHELAHMDFSKYGVVPFKELSRTPVKENNNLRFSRNILSSIVGTIIGKNKVKGSLDLLTPEGTVVLIKMYKGEFSLWDKQISVKDGSKKKVIEKSFFERGNKLYLTGFRRDDQFVPKEYNNTPTPKIGKITNVRKDGSIELVIGRAG